jgi:predicted double-glycine peptidase
MEQKQLFIKSKILIVIMLCFINYISADSEKIKSFKEIKYLDINRQTAEFTCGIAVLSTLFNYYGISTTEEEITNEFFKKMVEEKRGITFLDMKEYAISKGFEAYGYKMNYSGLIKIVGETSLPIIVHMKYNFPEKEVKHFGLIICNIGDDWLVLDDTEVGRKIVSKDKFLSLWTGYAMIIKPNSNSEELLRNIHKKIEKRKTEASLNVSKIYLYQNFPIVKHYSSF